MSSNTSDDGSWYAANSFESGEHGGTHMDAPYHFYKSGWQIGDIPLERLIGKGRLKRLQKSNGFLYRGFQNFRYKILNIVPLICTNTKYPIIIQQG